VFFYEFEKIFFKLKIHKILGEFEKIFFKLKIHKILGEFEKIFFIFN